MTATPRKPLIHKGLGLEYRHQKVDPFKLLVTHERLLEVPSGYNHKTCIRSFRDKHEKNLEHFSVAVSDINYARATTQLVPGQKFSVQIYGIECGKWVSSPACIEKIQKVNGVLLGAQGLSLVFDQLVFGQAGNVLMPDCTHLSFDEMEELPRIQQKYRIPYLSRDPDGYRLYHQDFDQNIYSDKVVFFVFIEV